MPQVDFEMMFEKKNPNHCHVQSIVSINHMSYMSMLDGTIVMDGPSKFDHRFMEPPHESFNVDG